MNTKQIAQERAAYLRSEFYYEAPRFTKAISSSMKTFVEDRIDKILDEFNMIGEIEEIHGLDLSVQPLDSSEPN